MGLKSAASNLFSGNWRDSFNALVTDEDAIETQQIVQNAQEKIIARQFADSLIDEEEAGEMMNQAAQSAHPWAWANEPGGDPAKVFSDSVKKDVMKIWKDPFGGLAKLIPWWAWVLLGLGALFYFWPIIRIGLSLRSKVG